MLLLMIQVPTRLIRNATIRPSLPGYEYTFYGKSANAAALQAPFGRLSVSVLPALRALAMSSGWSALPRKDQW